MKAQMMNLMISLAMLGTSVSAFAEFEKHAPAKINFNQMIEENHQESGSLQADLSRKGFGQKPKANSPKDKRVTDFIDTEIGWGEAPKIVDRRYNSVTE
jgi:hypothetical protein